MFLRLTFGYYYISKDYFDKLGVHHVEDLKHLENDNWKYVIDDILQLNFIHTKQINMYIAILERTGGVNPFWGDHVPSKVSDS